MNMTMNHRTRYTLMMMTMTGMFTMAHHGLMWHGTSEASHQCMVLPWWMIFWQATSLTMKFCQNAATPARSASQRTRQMINDKAWNAGHAPKCLKYAKLIFLQNQAKFELERMNASPLLKFLATLIHPGNCVGKKQLKTTTENDTWTQIFWLYLYYWKTDIHMLWKCIQLAFIWHLVYIMPLLHTDCGL